MSVISKRSFTYGKCLQGNIGLDTWALSVIFPCLRFAAEKGRLSCCLNLLPSLVFSQRLCPCSLFFFSFWNNGCFWESWKVGHCVFGLEKEDPEAGALPSPLRKDESWHSSPSSGLQTKRVFCFGYVCSVLLNMCIRLLNKRGITGTGRRRMLAWYWGLAQQAVWP